jgi:hypothetical protein
MDDDGRIPECDDCTDYGGMCDMPHLENGRYFSLILKEGFKYFTVCNFGGTYLFLIKHDLRIFALMYNFHLL